MHRLTPTKLPARHRRRLALAAALAALPLATATAERKPNDPLEKLNRATYAFNDALDRMLAKPAAKAYKKAVPEPARKAVSNFVANLGYPVTMVNDALQGKLKAAGSDVLRLIVNTTIGVGGLFDPATKLGLVAHDEDFGQTLGVWGVPPGPYLMLPLVGPSDFRDGPARLVDAYSTPYQYAKSSKTKWGLYALTLLDRRTDLLSADTSITNAYDPYVFIRNAYVARREYLVRDGNVPDEDDMDDTTGARTPMVPALPSLSAPPAPPQALLAFDRGADLLEAPGARAERAPSAGEP